MLIIIGVVILVVLITLYNDTDCCFVVTVANPDKLNDFRSYRDNVLSQRTLGRLFIEIYYAGLGPALALLCILCPPVRWLAKSVLEYIHKHYLR